jgi:uncharacterized OB-fold protein
MSETRQVIFLHEGLLERIDGQWRLVGSRCEACGDVRFPAAFGCPNCHSGQDTLRRHPLSTVGSVFAFSRVMKAPAPFKGPYVLAYVQLPEGPRVLAQLECAPDEEVFGKSCDLTVGILWETASAIGEGYKFKLCTP